MKNQLAWRALAAFAFFFVFSLSSFATGNAEPISPEEKSGLTQSLREFFIPSQFDLTNLSKSDAGNGETNYGGTATFFGLTPVQVTIRAAGPTKIREIKADFPASAKIVPMKALNRIVDIETLRNAVPNSFLLAENLYIRTFSLTLGEDGKSFGGFSAEIASDDWDFMGMGGLRMSGAALTLFVRNEQGKKTVGGNIKGGVSIGSAQVAVDATLTNKKEDLLIKGSSTQALKLAAVLKYLGGDALNQEFNGMVPPGVADLIEVPAFTFSAAPGTGVFQLNTTGTVGKQEMRIRSMGSKSFFTYSYSPNTDYKFANLHSSLSWLDQAAIKFQELKLQVSNDPDSRPARIGNPPIGLDVEATIVPTDKMSAFLKPDAGRKLVMRGGIDAAFNVLLSLDAELNIDLGGGWKYEGVTLYVQNTTGARGPNLGMRGSILVPVDNTKLRFALGLSGQPAAAALAGDLHLQSINDNGQLTEWREPFGVPYVTFTELGGAVGVSGSTLIDHIGLKGDIKLGAMPKGGIDRRLSGKLDTRVDVDVMESWVKAELNQFTFLKAIQAFYPDVEFPGEVGRFLNVGVENGKADINPRDKSLAIEGDAVFYGIKGRISIKAGKTGVSAGGSIDPVNVEVEGQKILSVQGLEGANSRPQFTIDLSASPKIIVKGKASVLGIGASETNVAIDKNGFMLNGKGKVLGGALSGAVNFVGNDFKNKGNMRFGLDVDLDALGKIREKILDFVRDEAGSFVADQIVDNILPNFSIKKVSLNSALKDLKMDADFSVSFVAGMFGQVEEFVVGVKARLDMSSTEAFLASLGKAIGQKLLDTFDFFSAGAKAAIAWVDENVGPIVAEMGKGFEEMGKGIVAVGEEVASWLEDRHFDHPASPGPANIIKPGYRHVKITCPGVYVSTTDEGNGDDVFGRVSMGISGDAYAVAGTNPHFFGRSENEDYGNTSAGSTVGNSNTKHIYVKQGATVRLTFTADLWEEDTGGDDQLSCNSATVTITDANVGSIPPATISCHEGSSNWTATLSVVADAPVSRNDLIAAIRTGDIGSVNNKIFQGGDMKTVGGEGVDIAAAGRNVRMLALLQVHGYGAESKHLAAARQGGFDMGTMYQLMAMGARPGPDDLQAAIDNKSYPLALYMMERGAAPNLNQLRGAFTAKQWELAEAIMRKGVKPEASDLTSAVQSNDNRLIDMMLAYHAPVQSSHLTEAAGKQNWRVLDELMLRAKPEQATFQKVAEANNTEQFGLLCRQGVPITAPEASYAAMERNNMEILVLCLQNGTKPYDVMTYGLQKDKLNGVENALLYGANANRAIDYSLDRDNQSLYTRLLTEFGADPNVALDHAYQKKSLKYVKLTLEKSNADASKYMADAANQGNWDMVNVMLENGGNPNLAMPGAIEKTNAKLVQTLLEYGAKADKPEYMAKASEKNNVPIMRSLLEYGAAADPGMKNSVGHNNFEAVKMLLEYGANPKGHMDVPATRGKADIVQVLLDYGADPNEGMKGATSNLHEGIVQTLLEHGAKPNGYMDTPARKGNLRIVTMLVEYGADPNEGLKGAVEGNHYPIATYLINYGALPKGLTAAASGNGNLKMVELMVDNGDDPEPGMLPAVKKPYLDIVKVLVDKYGVDATKQTYIITAVAETDNGSHAKVAEFLLARGSDPNKYRDQKKGNSLLHLVCDKRGSLDRDLAMVKVLLAGGAEVNAVNNELWTPLHSAANKARKNLEMVQALVEAGADVNACTDKNKSVYKIAEGKDVKDYLESKGAVKKCAKDTE